ncbi:hypothetical protein B0H14DRAFT_3554112 [Mycena olivaceomarginata]|nr:hypothetical protein B0H14DRAFT_3554112 [Mycena olivaceomarginata]
MQATDWSPRNDWLELAENRAVLEGKVLKFFNPAVFRYNEEHTRIQCKLCAPRAPDPDKIWIAVASALPHLSSRPHLQAVELAGEEKRRLEKLAKERERESATNALRDVDCARHHAPGPLAATSSRVISEEETKMWADYLENGAEFSAGDDVESPEARHGQLREEARYFGLWNPGATAKELGFGEGAEVIEEDGEDDYLGEILRNVDLPDTEPDQILEAEMPAPRVTAQNLDWYPYPNRMMFLLDTLDNLPRLRVSSSLMRVFLWVLKEARCKDVPSFDRLRKVQKDIRSQCGIPSIPCRSVQGNVFFMNDPRTIIAQDWSNPATRKLIRVYPEIPEDGIIREFWHAKKWRKTMDLDTLSPMYDAGSKHYYVNEIARLQDDSLVIPVRWVTFRGKVYADAYAVKLDSQGQATVVDTETIFVCTDALSENYHDLEHGGTMPKFNGEFTPTNVLHILIQSASAVDAGYLDSMPNPKRKIAAGRPMYSSFINYFSDDVSGNRTKSWNKHWNAYMTHEICPGSSTSRSSTSILFPHLRTQPLRSSFKNSRLQRKVDSDVEDVEIIKPALVPQKIVLMVPEAATEGSQRVSLKSSISFEDAIELMHETIGCVSVGRKPTLAYKFSTANKNTTTINLRTKDDWEGLVTDVLAKMKTKKDIQVNISVLPENYMISLRAKNKKKAPATTTGKGKRKLTIMDLDNDDEEGENDDDEDVETGEKKALADLDAVYRACVRCGPTVLCKIDQSAPCMGR